MKHVKKLASLLLMLVMIISLATPAFAATVTVPTEGILKDHEFTAYQVFSGREENGVLSDIEWGDGINNAAFLAALKEDATYGDLFANCTTAANVAKVLGDNINNTDLANQVAKLAKVHKGAGIDLDPGSNTLEDGYYLIVDSTADVGEGGAYNATLLKVVGNINITVKTDAPSVEKKVLEDDKYTANDGYGTGYNDVADHDMGEAVHFHLIGTVPDMSHYDTYKYIFHDTLSAGLTAPEANNIKVYLSADKKVDTGDNLLNAGYSANVNGQVITVTFNNLKAIPNITEDMYIIVEYSAVLNHNAEVGLPGNPNVVYLEYSNKPDQSGAGDTDNTGETPEDKVIVFTYELDVTKVDGTHTETKLQDAKFVLLNADKNKVAEVNANGKFVKWINIPEADAQGVITWSEASILTSGVDGLFKVIGLDDGTYYLKEIVAPVGYNLLAAEIEVIITAETKNGQNWTDGLPGSALTNLTVTADGVEGTGYVVGDKTGIAEITIANNAGSTLPETGGIGTTIFYVLGSILFVGAIVLLVTKKRMRHGDK